jgi:hypothetical protein
LLSLSSSACTLRCLSSTESSQDNYSLWDWSISASIPSNPASMANF